jgi:hypothetical protein
MVFPPFGRSSTLAFGTPESVSALIHGNSHGIPPKNNYTIGWISMTNEDPAEGTELWYARNHLRAAREFLAQDEYYENCGYAREPDDYIAPRISELVNHLRHRVVELETRLGPSADPHVFLECGHTGKLRQEHETDECDCHDEPFRRVVTASLPVGNQPADVRFVLVDGRTTPQCLHGGVWRTPSMEEWGGVLAHIAEQREAFELLWPRRTGRHAW